MKVLVIHSCYECSYRNEGMICRQTGKRFLSYRTRKFPLWCPLQDTQESPKKVKCCETMDDKGKLYKCCLPAGHTDIHQSSEDKAGWSFVWKTSKGTK